MAEIGSRFAGLDFRSLFYPICGWGQGMNWPTPTRRFSMGNPRRISSLYSSGAVMKGANPGELTVDTSTEYELVVNKKAAAALGIAIPGSILARANRVIE
jgi:hypothetical protein